MPGYPALLYLKPIGQKLFTLLQGKASKVKAVSPKTGTAAEPSIMN